MPAVAALTMISPQLGIVQQQDSGFRPFLGSVSSFIGKSKALFHLALMLVK